MNFLAHAFLSFDDPKILVGNLIGDFVRGNLVDKFEKEIIEGIILHRAIDQFTDTHPVVKKAQVWLKPKFSRYSTVITDVYFDFFLAKYWNEYDSRELNDFAQSVYGVLDQHIEILPDSFLPAFYHMKKDNWLVAYGTLEGMQKALTGISERTSFMSNMENSHYFLENNQDLYKAYFDDFFPDLINYSINKTAEIKQA